MIGALQFRRKPSGCFKAARLLVGLILGATTLAFLLPPAQACTTFCIPDQDGWVFGSNLDWMVEDGMVVVNKRGVAKTAYSRQNPARWISRYGSVTFNQYGRELPMGGMNEAGLIIDNTSFLRRVPQATRERLARYPETLECVR